MTVGEFKKILATIPDVREVTIAAIDSAGMYLGTGEIEEVEELEDQVRVWVEV
jgi:hypothetical protein